MNFEEALKGELISVSLDLKEVTDKGVIEKVFPLNAPEGTKPPFIVYVSSEGLQDMTLDGYSENKEIECEINILHSGYGNMKALTKEVLAKILSFQGRAIGLDGPFIHDLTYEKPVEIYENEVALFRSVLTITVCI
jgi:hypothetical protein